MPKFNEGEPEDFFSSFEEVAEKLGWEEDRWALLAQTVFPAKAQTAYLAIPAELRSDYGRVKEEVLRAYEVTPEYYRTRFRSTKMGLGKRFAEYARDLDRNLTKWWRALGADTWEKVKEAIWLEQFLQGVSQEVRVYLSERRVSSVSEATSLAEDFVLIAKQGREAAGRQWREVNRSRPSHVGTDSNSHRPRCLKCGSQMHVAWQCRQPTGPNWQNAGTRSENGSASAKGKCFECGQVGHLAYECPRRKTQQKGAGRGGGKVTGAIAGVA